MLFCILLLLLDTTRELGTESCRGEPSARSPEVSDPAHEVHGAVPDGDQGVLAEQDGLRPHGRLGELGKHDSSHARLKYEVTMKLLELETNLREV